MRYKHKNPLDFRGTRPACPQCKAKLSAKNFQVIFKDVLECFSCGKIWVSFAIDFFIKKTDCKRLVVLK